MTQDTETFYFMRDGEWTSKTFNITFSSADAEAWMVNNNVRPPLYSVESGKFWYSYIDPGKGFKAIGFADGETPTSLPEQVKLMHLLLS